MGRDLSNLEIGHSFEGLVQISGSLITDGTGSLIPALDITASMANTASLALNAISSSFSNTAISSSHAINANTAISSSHAESSDSSNSVEFGNITSKPTLVSGSSQISYPDLTNIPSGIVSGSSQVYYPDLTSIPSGIISGSSQVTFEGITGKPTLISGSSQVTFAGITGKPTLISGSSQITYPNISSIPSGIISSSAQLNGSTLTINATGSFTGSFKGDGSQLTGIVTEIPSGTISGSVQVIYPEITNIPSGIISGSSQVSYPNISNIPAGIISGSSQVSFNTISDKPTLVSSSAQISYPSLSSIPSGIVSGSSQLTSSYDSRYQQTSQKGQANGYASLDANSIVPMAQLSSSVFTKNDFSDIGRQGITNRAETTVNFDGTNTFTITPTATQWSYFRSGFKYTVTGAKTVVIPGSPIAAGSWYIYIDDNIGTLTASQTVWTLQDTKVPIAVINFNNALTPKFWISDERHSISIDGFMQYYLHNVDGARSIDTPSLSGYTVDTDTNIAKTFGVSAGTLIDQDIVHTLPLLPDPDGTATDYVIWYRSGVGNWVWKLSNMPFLYNSSTNWIQYDNSGTATDLTGGAGGAVRWANSYLLLTNKNGAARFLIIPGRQVFTSLAAAKAESISEFDWTGFPLEESVIAYQLTWSTITSTSTGKCRLADVPTLVNISTVTNNSSGAGTDHNTLSNLQGGTLGEYYHITAAEKTVVANTSGTNTGDQDLSGFISSSAQISYPDISNIPSGIVSGSSQISYVDLSNIPSGIVSGSDQLPTKADLASPTFTGTASGSFTGSFEGDVTLKDDYVTLPKVGPNFKTRVTSNTSGSYAIDRNSGSIFELTMTAATTFSDSNLASGTNTEDIMIILSGNFVPTFPTYWEATPYSDAYSGAKRNLINVVTVNGTTSSEDVIYQLQNLAT